MMSTLVYVFVQKAMRRSRHSRRQLAFVSTTRRCTIVTARYVRPIAALGSSSRHDLLWRSGKTLGGSPYIEDPIEVHSSSLSFASDWDRDRGRANYATHVCAEKTRLDWRSPVYKFDVCLRCLDKADR